MVNGKKINLSFADDATDPATGVSKMKDFIGQGYTLIAGATSSGVALQEAPLAAQNHVLFISGPAASDAVTGLNKYTFRSGRQTYQDVADASTYLTGTGKNVVVFAQDSAFGQGNYVAVKAIIGKKNNVTPDLRAADRDRLHAVRAAGQAGEPGSASTSRGPARPPRRCGRRSTSRACSERQDDRDRTRRAGDLP